jgi:hypothetical protein
MLNAIGLGVALAHTYHGWTTDMLNAIGLGVALAHTYHVLPTRIAVGQTAVFLIFLFSE